MSLPIRKFREMVFQILFSFHSDEQQEEELYAFFMKQLKVSKKQVKEAVEFARDIQKHFEKIDAKIEEASQSYRLERIGLVEKNILRLGIYELFYGKKTAPQVVISEAIRLCRKFATSEAADYVNAILDHVYKKETPNPS